MNGRKNERIDKLRLPILVILLLFISCLILYQIDKRINEAQKREIINNEKRITELNTTLLNSDFQNILNDLHFLEGSYHLYLNNSIGISNVEEIWKLFSEESQKYDQIRFIDVNGNETIRVNYMNHKSYTCQKKELQNKKDRYYFYETERLTKNQHYISKLDLNIEQNKIEEPKKPMIRVSTKIYNNNNEYIGIIVINYLAERMLYDFIKISQNSVGEFYLINSNGYWIAGGKENENWAFMYEDRKNISFKNKFPFEWKEMNEGKKLIKSENGIYIWEELKLEDKYHEKSEANEDTVVLGDGNFRAVSFISKNSKYGYVFLENISEKIYRIVSTNIVLLTLLILIAIMIEILIAISKNAYTKMKDIAEHDGLTKVYNRRAGMEKLEKLLQKDNRRKSNQISICFVDVNGLKQVNDILGHEKGDELILTVANTMKKILREDDLIIRFGGDEFVIAFIESNVEIAEKIWERIVEAFEKINKSENRRYIISVSHGIVESNETQEKLVDKILKVADEKMYEEKKKIKKEGFDVIK